MNGTLRGQSIAAASVGAPSRVYLTIGANALHGSYCQTGAIAQGQFYGTLDELRIFNRELTEREICALAGYTI